MNSKLSVFWGAALLLAAPCLASGAPMAANPKSPATYDAQYFRSLLDKEGPGGLVDRLYVGPADLMTPLLSGISTGAVEWIDVYDRCRRGIDSADPSGATKGRLDDALARALGKETERVVSYLHAHPEIPASQICGRTATRSEDPGQVLEPRELLTIIQRQRNLSRIADPALQTERAACLAATSDVLHRQLRIYLASYGAENSKSKAVAELSDSEKRELEAVVAPARKDPTLRARRDGTFPDGPFRVEDIPRDVLKYCGDHSGRIANPEGPWEVTDATRDQRLPEARLLSACRATADDWDITCQQGGFAPYIRHIRVHRSGDKWTVVQEEDSRRSKAAPEGKRIDPWPECGAPSKPSSASATRPKSR